jgi:hypothetical protein
MKTQIDPFNVACMTLLAFSIMFIGCLAYTDVKETEIKSNLIREAIQKGWTPEQVKEILKTR